jgi:RNA-directed DNA polymerase
LVNVPGRNLEVGTARLIRIIPSLTVDLFEQVPLMPFFDWLFQQTFGKPKPAPEPTPPPPPPGESAALTAGSPPPQPQQPQPPRRRDVLLGLEAADLLPITETELKESLQELTRKNAFRLGIRGSIPPGHDERTQLIGRALVTHGLLTADQLVEIHRIGAEHDQLRRAEEVAKQQAEFSAQAAIRADREQRAKRKEQKKAESAERKRKHAEEIAQRRATDIIFLGRGVSGRLHLRQSDTAKLQTAGLPVMSTPADVAAALGLPIPKLRWLLFHTEVATRIHYIHFQVPKRSGGTRTLSAPHRTLKTAQHWIFENILTKLPVEAPAHGFVTGRSIVTNAQQHVGRKVVLNMDLEGFFPSIGFPRVRSVFFRLGYSPCVATMLALLCTECPRKEVVYDGKKYFVATGQRGLPQGACTSPALSNQVARRLDKRLGGLAVKMKLTYTRYADDLSFSGDQELNERVGYLMARVRHIAQEEGFGVNEKKSRVLRRNTAQKVTGLVVNDKPGVSRKEVRRLRAILHRARTEGLEQQNREGRANFVAWLTGKIAYVSMVRPEVGAKLKGELQALLQR